MQCNAHHLPGLNTRYNYILAAMLRTPLQRKLALSLLFLFVIIANVIIIVSIIPSVHPWDPRRLGCTGTGRTRPGCRGGGRQLPASWSRDDVAVVVVVVAVVEWQHQCQVLLLFSVSPPLVYWRHLRRSSWNAQTCLDFPKFCSVVLPTLII